jgi:hypothetical protein
MKQKIASRVLTKESLMEIAREIKARNCHLPENQISDEDFDKHSKDITGTGTVVISIGQTPKK